MKLRFTVDGIIYQHGLVGVMIAVEDISPTADDGLYDTDAIYWHNTQDGIDELDIELDLLGADEELALVGVAHRELQIRGYQPFATWQKQDGPETTHAPAEQ